MFAYNKNLMKCLYTIEAEYAVDQALLCWSPTLGCDIYIDADGDHSGNSLYTIYDIEETTDKPALYSGYQPLDQSWMILRNKKNNQIFWTSADQFQVDENGAPHFIHNDGLDIDSKSITFNEYDSNVIYTNENDISWNVGGNLDMEEGKLELYHAIDSNESTGTDEDDDETFSQLPQEKFEAIKQLFQRAGFKVKVRRLPKNS